jgi:hypothetical protein
MKIEWLVALPVLALILCLIGGLGLLTSNVSAGTSPGRQLIEQQNRAALARIQGDAIAEGMTSQRTITLEVSKQSAIGLQGAIEASKRYELGKYSLEVGKLVSVEEADGKLRVTLELVAK